MSDRHPYLATFAATCSACGRPRSSPLHDTSAEGLVMVRCPFCGVELDAAGDAVSVHFHSQHNIILCRRGASEGVWTQAGLDEWLEIISEMRQRQRERERDGGS